MDRSVTCMPLNEMLHKDCCSVVNCGVVLPGQKTGLRECDETTHGDGVIPLFSSRPLMLCEPDLAADMSNVPESMSSTSDRAVSKLLFMVVAITPVGPVFSQPLQYRPIGKDRFTTCFCSCENVLCGIY